MSGLPKGWISAALETMADFEMGQAPPGSASNFCGVGTPFVKAGEFRETTPAIQEWTTEPLKYGRASDIFICVVGATAGKLNLGVDCAIGRSVAAIRPKATELQKFLYYQLLLRVKELRAASSGSAQGVISRNDLAKLDVRIAPIPEQKRVVSAIDELLSDLDAGVAELQAAQKKLTQYRQSLLKAAVEGALTADWRAQHPPAETGAQLLQRILTERRARWEARQLDRFKSQGKAPPPGWQKKYVEPVPPDTTGLPALPQGWVWATIDQLSVDQRYGSSAKTSEDDAGVAVLRMGNIQDGRLDIEKLKYLPIDHDEFPDLFLQSGDMLFNRTNSPELVGKTAVFRAEIEPCSYASYLIAVRFAHGVVPELVSSYINSSYGRHWVKSVVVQQVGQANVNGSKLAALAVPLAPEDEQSEIFRCLQEQEQSVFDQEANIEKALKQSTAQRQNILRAAFSGQLVPQDPSDEPASALLARIRAERAAQAPARKPRGRKTQGAA